MDDLNHIHLTPAAIAALYHNVLIDTGEEAPASPKVLPVAEQTPPPPVHTQEDWKFLGQNLKNILIVLDYPDAVYLPDDELTFLTNMLTACKLSLADVAIINRHHQSDVGYKEWIQRLKSKNVLLFGVDPASFALPMSFPEFQVQTFTGTTFLYAPSLAECRDDGLVKSKLWVCLRRIFGV